MIRVEPFKAEDIPNVVPRDADIEEIASLGHTVEEMLEYAAENGGQKMVGPDGVIVSVFGCSWHPSGAAGVPWLLSTVYTAAHKMGFLNASAEAVKGMIDEHGVLMNYVHADNHLAIRWLKWLGFEMGDITPYGPNMAPFRRFEMQGD